MGREMGKAQRTTGSQVSKAAFSRKFVSFGRHEHGCKVCSHAGREEIDRDFINWKSPALIAREYGLKDRSSVYRHANALDLFPKRQRNTRRGPRNYLLLFASF